MSREARPHVIVFLSAVSREFHEPDPANPRGFQSYRNVLAHALRRMGPAFSVIVQEDFAQGFIESQESNARSALHGVDCPA